MSAMDNMVIAILQKMTGLTPEEMQSLSQQAINLLQSLDGRLAAIERQLNINHTKIDPIMGELKGIEYVESNSN